MRSLVEALCFPPKACLFSTCVQGYYDLVERVANLHQGHCSIRLFHQCGARKKKSKKRTGNLISQVGTNGIRPNQIPARIVAAQIPHSSAPLKCPLCLDLIVAVPYRRIRLILQFLDLPAVFYFRRRSTRIQNRLVIVVGTSIYSLPRLIAELVHN